jgi:hypothetical protein
MSRTFDEALKRAKAALRRETNDPHYIPDRLLHEFAKEIARAYLDGVNEARSNEPQCLTMADKLAAEAQSYLEIGHTIGDEDQPLEDALNAYRALRLL